MTTRTERFAYTVNDEIYTSDDVDLENIVYRTFGLLDANAFLVPNEEDLRVYTPDTVHNIEDLRVVVDRTEDAKIQWSIVVPYHISRSVQASTMRSLLQEKVFCCGMQDFTFGSLVADTDVKFSSVFGDDGAPGSVQSPDYLKFSPLLGGYVLSEFFTSHVHNPEHMKMRALDKMMKYEHNFRRRCQKKYLPGCMSVVGVTAMGVVSNLNLSMETVNELTLRFRIFDMVLQDAYEQQLVPRCNERDSHTGRVDNALARISHLPLAKFNNFSFDDQTANRLKGEPTDEQVDSLMKRVREEAMIDRCQGCKPPQLIQPTRSDLKDVVLLPFWVVGCVSRLRVPSSDMIGLGSNATGRLWRQAITDYRSHPDKYHPDYEKLEKVSKILRGDDVPEELKTTKEQRKSYHTFSCDLVSDEWLELAEFGIQAKRVRDDPLLMELRSRKKLGFSYDTPTVDISSFLKNYKLLKPQDTDDYLQSLVDMEDETRDIQGRVLLKSTEQALTFRQSKLWKACSLISQVAQEIAISFKQNRKKDEFILKRVGDTPVLLLLKPTRGGSHMFFSMGVMEDAIKFSIDGPFRRSQTVDGWTFTEFSSVKRDRVENWFRAPMLVPSLVTFFCDTYNVDLRDFSSKPENFPTLVSNIMACVLMNLENKEITEEIVTLTRFMYMESTRYNPVNPRVKPTKILSKFPKVIRSRYAIFLANQIIRCCEHMEKTPPRPILADEELSSEEELHIEKDSWLGLINFIDGSELGSFRKALDIAFIGYLRSKDSNSDANSAHKMVQKILEEELKLDKSSPETYNGSVEPVGEGPHTWSLTAVQSMASCFKSYMRQTFGAPWEAKLADEIDNSLINLDWNELATFKASSVMETNIEPPTYKKNPNEVHRKAINAILDTAKYDHPIDQLFDCLKDLSSKVSGVSADLFKKQQHGGLREIYVLDIKSRIVQLVLEKISRCLCSFIPFETMTHPTVKRSLIDDHHHHVFRTNKKGWVTNYNSDDAKRWNQNFMMDQFLALLLNVLPSKYHKLVTLTLNLWTNKAIKVPQGIINTFCRDNQVRFQSKEINLILDQMLDGGDMVQRGDNKMRIVSGMMQGILHYTSSFYHACSLLLTKKVIATACRSQELQHVVTTMVSSDDSGLIVSVRGSQGVEFLHSAAYQMCRIKTAVSTMCGILTSKEKSTEASTTTFEFNSEFYNMHTHIRPRIKHLIAAHKVPVESSLINRQNGLSSLNSQLLEDGCPFNILAIVQYAQMEIHYRCIGLTTNPLFWEYWEMLMKLPSPHLGFFMLDHPLMCGVAGSEYNHWDLQYRNVDVAGYLAFLMQDNKDYGAKGSVEASFHVTQGNGMKFRKMREQARKYIGLDEPDKVFDDKPELLYTSPESLQESKLKIYLKYLNPMLRDSFENSHSSSVVLASSVYFVSSHCIHPFLSDRMKDEEEDLMGKLCLMALIEKIQNRIPSRRCLSAKEESFLFPLSSSYRHIHSLMKEFSEDPGMVQVIRRRRRVVRVTMDSLQTPSTVNVTQLCGFKWFGAPYHKSRQQIEFEWSLMGQLIPWLKLSHKESLDESNFSTPIQMFNYLNSLVAKKRTLYISAPAVGTAKGVQMLPSLVKLNQHSYKTMRTDVRDTAALTQIDMFNLACLGPPYPSQETARKIGFEALIAVDCPSTNHILSMDSKTALFYGAAKFSQQGLTSEELKQVLWRSKRCRIGCFTKRQPRENRAYVGPGCWLGNLLDQPIRLQLDGETCTCITTNDIRHLSFNVVELSKLLDELQLGIKRSTWGTFRFDGKEITRVSPGVRVIEDRRLVYEMPCTLAASVDIGCVETMGGYRANCIQLKVGATGRSGSKERYIAKTLYIQPNPDTMIPILKSEPSTTWDPPERRIRACWKKSEPIPRGLGLPLLLAVKKRRYHLTEWCKESLLKRAKALQVDLTPVEVPSSIREEEVQEEFEKTPFTIEEFSLNYVSTVDTTDLDNIAQEFAEGENINEMVSTQMLEDYVQALAPLLYEVEETPVVPIEYRHSLWDETIHDIRSHSHDLSRIKQGFKIEDKRLEEVFCWLVGVDQKGLKAPSCIDWDLT